MPRLFGGAFKGRMIAAPRAIRATEAKVRQALFNILGQAVEGARVADVFAGSGALGLEALSRGAAFAAFIESDPEAVACIQDNLQLFANELPREAWRVIHLDAERGLRTLAETAAPLDIVLLDPPYRTDDGKKALKTLNDCAILAPTGIVVIEHDRRTVLPPSIGPLTQWKQHRYGDTVLSLYQAGFQRP